MALAASPPHQRSQEQRPQQESQLVLDDVEEDQQHQPIKRARRRRVCFIDEILGQSSHKNNLVTRIAYRPSTPAEDKYLLYYTSRDYDFFALEEYYQQREEMTMKVPKYSSPEEKVFSWEDCMVYEDGCYDDEGDSTMEEDSAGVGEEGTLMHKVKTLHDLQS